MSGFSTNYLRVKILALGRSVSLIFCHANAKLSRKHWNIIVIIVGKQTYRRVARNTWSRFLVSVINSFVCEQIKSIFALSHNCMYSSVFAELKSKDRKFRDLV